MQERLNRLYEQYGYRKFKMSRFEDYDLYAQNRDFLRQDRIITFTDADGALKALKPDITLSIMKSNGGDSEKVYYNENVCREVGGAFREILQVGVESVGQIDPYAEAEVIALAARSLEQLSPKYVLALSDVSFVGSLLDQMGLSAPVRGKVLGLVARKNVPGLCVLAERGELTGEQADGLRELVELYAPLKEGIGRVGRLAKSNAAWETLRQLSLTAGLLESFGLEERVRLDFSLVNSMDYYNGVVYYNENVCREVGGAFREILQVGVESVGQIDPYAEAEVIALAARSLEQLSPKYVLALSDVSFVGSLLDQMGLSAPVRGKVLGLVARKNVPGLCVLAERGELTGEQADGLRELVELYAPLKEGIGRVGRLAKSNAAWETLRQLSLTAGLLESFGLEERVRLDFSLVNSMDYYNGVIFQGFLPGLHTPVLSGGRYDNLPRKMGKQVGAIGFALSMGLLEERADGGRFDADVLLTYGPDAELAGLAAFAEALRASGRSVRCERAGGSAQLRCRTELRYRSGMTPEEVGL